VAGAGVERARHGGAARHTEVVCLR
jgi:hypothetical protein